MPLQSAFPHHPHWIVRIRLFDISLTCNGPWSSWERFFRHEFLRADESQPVIPNVKLVLIRGSFPGDKDAPAWAELILGQRLIELHLNGAAHDSGNVFTKVFFKE